MVCGNRLMLLYNIIIAVLFAFPYKSQPNETYILPNTPHNDAWSNLVHVLFKSKWCGCVWNNVSTRFRVAHIWVNSMQLCSPGTAHWIIQSNHFTNIHHWINTWLKFDVLTQFNTNKLNEVQWNCVVRLNGINCCRFLVYAENVRSDWYITKFKLSSCAPKYADAGSI